MTTSIQALVDALVKISSKNKNGWAFYGGEEAAAIATQALADYHKSQKEESCDAMGHYGADKPEGICPKCNKSW